MKDALIEGDIATLVGIGSGDHLERDKARLLVDLLASLLQAVWKFCNGTVPNVSEARWCRTCVLTTRILWHKQRPGFPPPPPRLKASQPSVGLDGLLSPQRQVVAGLRRLQQRFHS